MKVHLNDLEGLTSRGVTVTWNPRMWLELHPNHVGTYDLADEVAVTIALDSTLFKQWVSSLDPRYEIKSILIQSVDLVAKRPLFIKFYAETYFEGRRVQGGVTVLRGDAVTTMLLFRYRDEWYSGILRQNRLPMGTADEVESPAGMMDGHGEPSVKMLEEIQEETGQRLEKNKIIPLHEFIKNCNNSFYASSPGLMDECIGCYVGFGGELSEEAFSKLDGSIHGLGEEEGEQTKVSLIPLSHVPLLSRDFKTMLMWSVITSHLGLWERQLVAIPMAA